MNLQLSLLIFVLMKRNGRNALVVMNGTQLFSWVYPFTLMPQIKMQNMFMKRSQISLEPNTRLLPAGNKIIKFI